MSTFQGSSPIMGLYRAPEKYEYLNYGDRPQDAVINSVIIHYTVGNYHQSYTTLTAERGVSSHYLIREDGRLDSLVPDEKKAWHAGVSNWRDKEGVNDFSIGIEIVNPGSGDQDCFPIECTDKSVTDCEKHLFTKEQLETLVELLSYLKEIHPNIADCNIIGHSDITSYNGRKIDPGVAFDWQYLANRGHGIYSNITASPTEVLYKLGDQGSGVAALQNKLKALGYNVTVNGDYDHHMGNTVRAYNLHFNQETENCWGSWDTTAELRLEDLLHNANIKVEELHVEL